MKEVLRKYMAMKAWGIFGFTTLMSIWAWSRLGSDITNIYRLFPLLGLIAFGTMWGHYVVWALRVWSGASPDSIRTYSTVTHYVVLVCILLHPALLIYQLQADGLGTPPASYEAYVGKALIGYIVIATVALAAFIAYEFKRWLHTRRRIWQGVLAANHLAMLLILIHALKLGSSVKQAPLSILMPLYGISLILIYFYLAINRKLV